MSITISISAVEISAAQRATLADWQAQLAKLVHHQRTCRARAVHGDLGRHLSSSLRGAQAAIAGACAPAAAELLAAAVEVITPYFRHPGDARRIAAQFDAFAELQGFLRGWKGEDTLAGLGRQAEATAQLIGRVLAGKTVWTFEGISK